MNIDQEQTVFVRDFLSYLTAHMQHNIQDFEKLQGFNKQELRVLRSLAPHKSLMVKGISEKCPDLSLSSLTRVLDRLEDKGAIIRNLNREDRRSFLVEITESGQRIVAELNKFIEQTAELMLKNLTPAERTMLIELYAKAWSALKEESKNTVEQPETAIT